ncbi:PAS domain-containing sensor histidine kinase [Mucilaginibacter rigui]|uniref:histidine kinase n=1 Tax=Mucilaginibacter rigui TaxID=534635 RepID=A0ABR7WZY4_9SPHI|nr:PAS domain S-box protein [Mucilaginibacter rigui]MBD1383889.1 PAS domain-containing sensor histidine kinase [Mucilaginibacter rigui]
MKSVDEKLFHLLVSSVKDYSIVLIDPNGHVLSWNEGAEHIKGYKAHEVIGRHISIFYKQDDNERLQLRHNLNQALKNGMYESEGWRVRKDGSVFWANVVFTTLYNDAGHLIGFAKVTRDITGQKLNEQKAADENARLERQLKANTDKIIANEVRFRELIEHSYDGYSLFNRDMKTIYRSRSSERINGWTYTDREAENIMAILHPDDVPLMQKGLPELLEHPEKTILFTVRIRHKLGHYIWVQGIFTNMLADKHIGAIICNFRDITEQKKAEEEREKMTADLLRRNQDLEQFAYMVSHNLRAPVANIAGLNTLLQDNEPDAAEHEHTLQALARSVNHLDQVIIDMNNILQVGSAANQQYEVVSIPVLIEDIMEGIRCMANESNLTIHQNLHPGGEVRTIKSYLYSILQNLIVNSIKYRRTGTNPVINISSHLTGKQLTLRFEDNGKGIDLYKYGSQVFGPYKRFDQSVDGKGLGLFMVKTQTERMGGTIKIESEVGVGTTFVITLPVEE